MNRRIILKTVIICTGLFLILSSLGLYYLFHNYKFDTEKIYQVLVASTDIDEGTVINESMVAVKSIKGSALNSYMLMDVKDITGKKALSKIGSGDYIRDYDLLSKEKWYSDGDRIIVLPVDTDARLANLIKKGSLIDIKGSLNNIKSIPKTVLSKVMVEDVLDENGVSLGNSGGGSKAYIKLVLDKNQRDRIYAATQLGKLVFELYCDSTQKASDEEFQIPPQFISGNIENQTDSGSQGNQPAQQPGSGSQGNQLEQQPGIQVKQNQIQEGGQ